MRFALRVFLILLVGIQVGASVFCEPCSEQKNSAGAGHLSALSEVSHFISAEERYQALRRDVNQLKNTNANRLSEQGRYLRDLRDEKISEPTRAFLKSATEDLQALSGVLVSIQSYNQSNARLSPTLRVESEEKARILQKAKIGILFRQPLLAHPKVKEFLTAKAKRQDFSGVSNSDIQNLLKEALQASTAKLSAENSEYADFLEDQSRPKKATDEYLSKMPARFPAVITRVTQLKRLSLKTLSPVERADFCGYENKLESRRFRNEALKVAGDVGALALSFAAGPFSRSAVLATAVGRAKLMEWGLVGASESYLAASSFTDYNEMLAKCDQHYTDFGGSPNGNDLNALEKCHQNLSRQLLQASLSLVMGIAPATANLYRTTATLASRSIPHMQREAVFAEGAFQKSGAVTYTHEAGQFTIFDLGSKDLVERKKLEELSDRYLDFVSQEYKKRLNLGKNEVDSFVETSKAFKDRTIYVISTAKTSKSEEIQGGVGLVSSYRSSDLLPLEKATGVALDRSEGGVAEIVRLTANKESSRQVSTELMDQVTQLVLSNPRLQTIYIYTSNTHARLYRRQNIFIKEDREFEGGRDVLLRIDVNDLRMQNRN